MHGRRLRLSTRIAYKANKIVERCNFVSNPRYSPPLPPFANIVKERKEVCSTNPPWLRRAEGILASLRMFHVSHLHGFSFLFSSTPLEELTGAQIPSPPSHISLDP